MKLQHLFDNNKKWAESMERDNPGFFGRLAQHQEPTYLWVGCSDSRVPASEILDLIPGDVFVHRNVANIIYHNDMNFLSVLQYGIKVLKIKDVIVCGHYGCGGVIASLDSKGTGLIDNWLKKIQDLYYYNEEKFTGLNDQEKIDLLCEINVIEQAKTIARTAIVKEHWEDGNELNIHGMIYSLEDGLLKNLGATLAQGSKLYD